MSKGIEYMDPHEKDPLPDLSDEELGRLYRERIIQNVNIESISSTDAESKDNWFIKQLKSNPINRLFDGLQRNAEKDFGIDDE